MSSKSCIVEVSILCLENIDISNNVEVKFKYKLYYNSYKEKIY